MNLYNGKINEYVDWKTGINTFTGENVTEGLPVSGKSIRELLQEKLKTPFYIYEDIANNLYRMFSSKDTYALWAENPSDYADLQLFSFVRPSDYKLDLTAINSDGFNNKFIRIGDTNSQGARIAFLWDIYNDEGQSSDSLSVTYTISNSSTGASNSFTRWYNRQDPNPDFSIYNYLSVGENIITIEGRGSTTGARNTKTFTISLLQINLTSTFDFCGKYNSNSVIQVPYTFSRNNTSGTAKIYFRIDDGGQNKIYTKDIILDGPTKVTEILMMLAELEEGKHTLLIWAEAKYNDGNTTIYSNLLYYTFTIASSVVGSTGKFINIHKSFETGNFPLSDLVLNATLYESISLLWGYYTDSLQTNTSIPIVWKLLNEDVEVSTIGNITANNLEKSSPLSFIPTIYTEEGINTYIAAYFKNTLIEKIPIYIVKNNKIKVNETGFYEIKMEAYGKTNDSSNKDTWTDTLGNVTTTFTGILWNTNSGWYDNSFRTVGVNEYAIINFNPFSNFNFSYGKTIEIEFESEKVSDENETLILIGNPNKARIEITADTATLYNNGNTAVVSTNYKSNERLKLAFIINAVLDDINSRTVESGLAYIVSNGILERAAVASGQSFVTEGNIKIGGSKSGVRVYNLRVYNYSISYMDAYNNYLYDSENKSEIASNNDILDSSGEISFDLCKNKLDTILISGNLSNILSGLTDKDDSTTDVTIERFCPFDSTKNIKINNVLIRKHGLSTLNYPITSMKMWFNKSMSGVIPTYELTQQENLLLNKNRYVMKSSTDSRKPSIPSNKFVLQANYADSSGVHNGSLLRLILKTWFNAKIDGEYKLRTAPQLFTTNLLIHHNDVNLGEDGSWVEGYGENNKLWKDVTSLDFPYDIRIAPDSFPCAVFYYDTETTLKRIFLGQYVFMEDKKSDFNYGERSIYAVPSDPFCLTNTHKDDDTAQNRVWSNSNVLRIEVVGSNVPFTSYMTHTGFTDIVTREELDINGNPTGKTISLYNWENAFELVYPDEDDIAEDDAKSGIDKFNPNSKYVAKVLPFINFHLWVTSTYKNQDKFLNEATQHLDLYKMAAYYIFVLRFGLVDSLERNVLLKTYDGIHWHYEPWDMDIALGNKNDGGIAYNPPIDRNTKLPGSISTYAISGRSADINTGEIVTSNWLWDALEAWPYWINVIVPKVADALFTAGLKYDEISNMFDNEYASKWCEIMYNNSGFFKYIESGKGDPTWLSWLQGSRMNHRHWWLSNSMDFYDAKWFCGDYKSHYIYIRANVTEGSHEYIRILPNKDTYITITKDEISLGTQAVSPQSPLVFDMAIGSATKNPIYFYGANFMEEIDLSDIAHGLDGVTLDGVYSEVLGSPLKSLNVGIHITESSDLNIDYTGTLAALGCQIQGTSNVFKSLQKLNIRGQLNQTDLNGLVYNNNITELLELYAMGSGLTNFYSSLSGNKFTHIELPDTIYTIWLNNSQWSNMSFWHAETDQNTNITGFKELSEIPINIHDVSLLGTTGSTQESILFVKNWINSLVNADVDLSEYSLTMDKINWSESTVGASNLLTFEELGYIAQLNNSKLLLKGYLVLKDTGTDLTSALLNTIKGWFGDTVFTKNSSGLVVDHRRQYVLINIGGNVTIDQLGNVTLLEGNSASLNATRFSLAEDDTTLYSWSIGPVNSNESYTRYNGLTVILLEDSIDGVAYILSTQSLTLANYDVKVTCSVEGVNYSTILHVIAATYPTDLFIDVENKGSSIIRQIPGWTEFYTSGLSARFFATSLLDYTGEINKTTYTFTRISDNRKVTYIDGGPSDDLDNLFDDYITISKSTTNGVVLSADTAMPEDLIKYKLEVEVLFKSGYRILASKNIILGDDSSPIVMSSSLLYTPINNAYQTQYGTSIGRNNIYKIDLMSLELPIDFSTLGALLPSFVTNNGSYLFKYLPNCEGINMDGCTAITNLNNNILGADKNLMNFSYMTKLKNLSILNCTGLTEDIDLTNNVEIEEIDASGTTINIDIPDGAKLIKYELGTPTKISIKNPTLLLYTNVVVDNSNNLEDLTIINMPNGDSFKTFAKIMNL